jgi:hypothetical protein
MIVTCCKCFRNTRKFVCPKCGHHVCTSCKEVKRKWTPAQVRAQKVFLDKAECERMNAEAPKVKINKAEKARNNEEVHRVITRYIREKM